MVRTPAALRLSRVFLMVQVAFASAAERSRFSTVGVKGVLEDLIPSSKQTGTS